MPGLWQQQLRISSKEKLGSRDFAPRITWGRFLGSPLCNVEVISMYSNFCVFETIEIQKVII